MKRSSEWFSRARASSASPSAAAPLGVAPQRGQALGQRGGLATRHAALGAEQLGQAAHRGGQHRHAGGHRLERRIGRELVRARAGRAARRRRRAAPPHARAASGPSSSTSAPRRARLRRQLRRHRPLAGELERHARARGGGDGQVGALLRRQPRGHQRVAALGRAGALRERLLRQVVRQALEPLGGHAEAGQLAHGIAARGHEAVDGREHRAADGAPAPPRRPPPRAASRGS